VRESPAVDQRSGVSARFAIACAEALSGAAVRRAAIAGDDDPVARIGDLAGVVPTLRGKVEFDVSEEGQEEETLQLLARRATADAWRAHLGGGDVRPVLTGLVEWFDEGNSLLAGDAIPAATMLDELGPLEGLGRLVATLEPGMAESAGLVAACVEFAVEGLWLTRRIDKDSIGGVSRYGSGS
jgi:magnesium chelatase subunit I